MKKVLLVEDDMLLGDTEKYALEKGGYEVTWVKSGNETFAALAETAYDLIYLDIMLPDGMDGYEILSHLKAPESAQREIPVIMLSNLGQHSEIEKAMEMGASGYVVKADISLDELVALTHKTLGDA